MGIIKQFNIVIYPVDFVVVIGDMEEEVNKKYVPFNEEYNYITPPKGTGATYRVKEEETEIPCIMVWIKDMQECTSSIISHECGHAALEIWSFIGSEVSLDNQEPFCYLLGNLVRLTVGTFYDIPGVKPPVVPKDKFENPSRKTQPVKKKG